MVAGQSVSGSNYDFSLIRLNADGSLDNTFGNSGKLLMPVGSTIDSGQSVIQQADGKLVVAGSSWNGNDWDFGLVRLNTNGSLDNTFGNSGKLLMPQWVRLMMLAGASSSKRMASWWWRALAGMEAPMISASCG